MKLFVIAAVLCFGACSGSTDTTGCATEEPTQLGQACEGDGECGNWLVCDAKCALPPAVLGEGGTTARLVSASETVELRVEVARSDLARQRGLSNRPCIADGWGLIIEYPTVGAHLITTQSMRFALDIAMIGEDGLVHTVHRDAPAGGKALYAANEVVERVLEVPAATVELHVGARLEYE